MTESSPAERVDALVDGVIEAVPEADEEMSESAAERSGRSGRPRRRRTWRRGGTSVQRWGWELFGWAVLALGVGVLGAGIVAQVVPGTLGGILSTVVLWAAFAVAIVLAFRRSVPRGLMPFRAVDVLYAVVLGGMLRLTQGWLTLAAGGSAAWPVYPSIAGSLPPTWAFDQLLSAVIVAPVLEEFFFRGVVLVAVYTGVRRISGRGTAAFAAAVVSTGLFVLAHAVLAGQSWDAVVSLALVGLVASILVLTTGRIWGAVLVHVVYNATWVAIATLGTVLAG